MLAKLIGNNILLINQKVSWQEAIKISFKPLLDNNSVKQSYVDAVINGVKKLGPYICIAPDFAMPHARPEDGVNKLGMSVLVSKEDIEFADNKTAKVFITLAAVDNNSHIDYIQKLMELIQNDLESLKNALSTKEIKRIISKY